MGHLGDPLNTFWQLFFRHAGTSRWTNEVEATGVATNGGLVLATSGGDSLAVGVEPSNLLTFSPLLATSDNGSSWATGLLPEGLARRPDALATSASGMSLALVGSGRASKVVVRGSDTSLWVTLSAESMLVSSPSGRACGIGQVTAVAYAGSTPVIGASCGAPGVVGIFADDHGAWRLAGALLPSSVAQGRVEVLGLQATTNPSADAGRPRTGLSALLAVSGASGTSLVAAWSSDGASAWSEAAGPVLGGDEQPASYGTASDNKIFVLLAGKTGIDRLFVVAGTQSSWRQLPSPPPGTATIASGPSGSLDALVTHDTVLSVWVLAPKVTRWVKGQVIDVPIQFGSSS
ncbi:MAG: hypothetical protein ACRDY2_07440 [Acidimicrobiales bacterium]